MGGGGVLLLWSDCATDESLTHSKSVLCVKKQVMDEAY